MRQAAKYGAWLDAAAVGAPQGNSNAFVSQQWQLRAQRMIYINARGPGCFDFEYYVQVGGCCGWWAGRRAGGEPLGLPDLPRPCVAPVHGTSRGTPPHPPPCTHPHHRLSRSTTQTWGPRRGSTSSCGSILCCWASSSRGRTGAGGRGPLPRGAWALAAHPLQNVCHSSMSKPPGGPRPCPLPGSPAPCRWATATGRRTCGRGGAAASTTTTTQNPTRTCAGRASTRVRRRGVRGGALHWGGTPWACV